MYRWCRRKPQVASLTAVALLVFLLGLAGVLGMWRHAESQRQRAEAGELSAQRRAYISEINSAQQALKASNPERALELLNRHRPEEKAESRIRFAGLRVGLPLATMPERGRSRRGRAAESHSLAGSVTRRALAGGRIGTRRRKGLESCDRRGGLCASRSGLEELR
jgi:hypothetical protein